MSELKRIAAQLMNGVSHDAIEYLENSRRASGMITERDVFEAFLILDGWKARVSCPQVEAAGFRVTAFGYSGRHKRVG